MLCYDMSQGGLPQTRRTGQQCHLEKNKNTSLVEHLTFIKVKLQCHEFAGAFTLNLGRLCWSSSASSISSVISILVLKRIGFGLGWLGLNELSLGACFSDRTGRIFLSLPNTTVSQSFNHFSRQRLVNYKEIITHNWHQRGILWHISLLKRVSFTE